MVFRFCAIDDLPLAHWDETEFSFQSFINNEKWKNSHDQFQRTICGRAGVEPATPGFAVRLSLDARRLSCNVYISRRMTKPTKWPLRPAKTQISLGIRPVWSESSLSAWRNIGSSATHWAHCEDSDQIGWMTRLIWVFAGRKGHFVGFVMRCLTFRKGILIFASDLRNKPHFRRPGSLAQSIVSLTAEPRIASSSSSPATYW